MALHEEPSVPCRGGAKPLESTEIDTLLVDLPAWSLVSREGVPQLERIHACADFATALHLVNRIGELAEAEDHHPELTIEWGRLTIRYWTHTLGGLHRNDFILAARTEQLLQAS